MSGSKRIAIGALLLLVGFVLVIAGSIVDSIPALGVGSLLFFLGIASVLWGAYASMVSWWRSRTQGSPPVALLGPYTSPPAYPYLPPPPPVTPARQQPQSPPAVPQMPATALPGRALGADGYAVDYVEKGAKKRALFKSYESALSFRQVAVSAIGLYRVTPRGDVPIADAPLARPTPAIPPVARRVTFTVDRAPEFLRVAEFIDQYRPSRRFDRELFLQIELAEALRGKFGREAVKTELPIPGGGRVDIEVCGVGVELKIAASTQALRDLPSQLESYREHYGPNLIAVVFDDTGDSKAVAASRDTTRELGVRLAVIRHR